MKLTAFILFSLTISFSTPINNHINDDLIGVWVAIAIVDYDFQVIESIETTTDILDFKKNGRFEWVLHNKSESGSWVYQKEANEVRLVKDSITDSEIEMAKYLGKSLQEVKTIVLPDIIINDEFLFVGVASEEFGKCLVKYKRKTSK